VTPPAGWLQLDDDTSSFRRWWYRFAAADDPSSWTFPMSLSRGVEGVIVAYRGVDPDTPFGASGTRVDSGTSGQVPALVAAPDPGGFYVGFGKSTSQEITAASITSGFTKRNARTVGSALRLVYVDSAVPAGTVVAPVALTYGGTQASVTNKSVWLAPGNVAPNAPVLVSPVDDGIIDRTVSNRFDWTFSDDDDGDSPSEFTIQVRVQGESTLDVDVTTETPTAHYDLPGGTLAAGLYEWRVRTRDAAGEQGPFSAWETFEAASPPAGPTITAPVNDGTIATEGYEVTWSAAGQDAYQLRRLGDDAGSPDATDVLFDTGQINSSGARSRLVNFPTNGQTEHVQVRVLRNSLWSPWSTVRVDVSYTPPAVPTATVTEGDGVITVSGTFPTPSGSEPDVESFDVERRITGETDGIRLAAQQTPASTFTDWTVASAVFYEYRIRARGVNGSSTLSVWAG